MSDQPKSPNQLEVPPPSPPVVKTEPVNAAPAEPEAAEDLKQVEKEMSGFERATLRWTRATFFIVLATGVFIGLQWHEMSVGGKDTSTLAEAAKQQAETMHVSEGRS